MENVCLLETEISDKLFYVEGWFYLESGFRDFSGGDSGQSMGTGRQ
jgi:hypothetical protein